MSSRLLAFPKLLVAAGAAVAVLGTAIVAVYLVSPQNKGASGDGPPPRLAEVGSRYDFSFAENVRAYSSCPALAPAEEAKPGISRCRIRVCKQGSTTCIGNLAPYTD